MAGLARVVVAGGSGTLGRALVSDLTARGLAVTVLTRRPDPRWDVDQRTWDGRTVGPWAAALDADSGVRSAARSDTGLDGADDGVVDRRVAVVNLAGRLVDVLPTRSNVADLRASRVDATRALVAASRTSSRPVGRWVQMSTTAIWSDAGDVPVTESTPVPDPGLPQMTGVARPWEEASADARTEHRVVLRTSLVLQPGSPVLDRLTSLARVGLGGKVAAGRQWVSWIHVDDWLAVVRAALGVEGPPLPDGVVVASAPTPVTNSELMAAVRRTTGRRFGLPTPRAVATLGAWALRSDPALGLTGRRCTSEVLDRVGWTFRFPTLDAALDDLRRGSPTPH